MSCCTSNIITFSNTPVTNVPYSGDYPYVEVVYFINGEYLVSNDFSAVQYKNGNINVSHGGVASGFIVVK